MRRGELAMLAALAAFACAVQGAVIAWAALPALDSVTFVYHAQSFAREGLLATLRAEAAPPLFPMLVWLVHDGLAAVGCLAEANWGTSAQIAAAIPLVLAVVVVYVQARRGALAEGEREAACRAGVATLLFICLTQTSRIGADGLSDSLHLFLVLCALWAASHYFANPASGGQRPTPWLMASGIGFGLAMLTRGESLLVLGVMLVALALLPAVDGPRRFTWRDVARRLAASGAMCVGVSLVLVPCLVAANALGPFDAAPRLLARQTARERTPFNCPAQAADGALATAPHAWTWPDGRSMTFGRKDTSSSLRFHGLAAALREFAAEFLQAMQYFLVPLAGWGLWLQRGRGASPWNRFLRALAAVYALVALAVATSSGYLSGRHMLLLVLLALPWGALGLRDLATRIAGRLPRPLARPFSTESLANLATLVLCAACVATTLRSVTFTNQPHRAAVAWMLNQDAPTGAVLDSRGYSALYSGRTTYRYDTAPEAFADPRLALVVVEQGEYDAPSPRGETMRAVLGRCATLAATFPSPAGKNPGQGVMVFRWSRERLAQYQGSNHAR